MLELQGYAVDGKLHESAARILYRGRREADGQRVIIKLAQGERPSPRELARMQHEFAILRDVDWPGIPRACGLEPLGHGLALVLEDIAAEPLSQLIASKSLDLRTSLWIARSIAHILSGVHARGIIHKDIKPHNILVDPKTRAVHLIDFGIAARLSHDAHALDRRDIVEGTLAYISPEQTGRMNRPVDTRSDFYSLGITLYEMLTGSLPFEQTDILSLLHNHIALMPMPPHERRASIPETVSALVMKLLAKPAEDRYQTAEGLVADLDECLKRLSAHGVIEPFPLGREDLSDELRIPHKLYGRERDLSRLLEMFEQASFGHARLLLISGAAGSGKSTLVGEAQAKVARRGGEFLRGKFERLRREQPFSALTDSLRQLLRRLLGEPEDKLATRRAQITDALGQQGQVLIDLLPELELVIGPKPPAPPVGATESQNRLSLAMQRFMRAFATEAQPILLFLDDLQWADSASLWLLSSLLSDPHGLHLLVVGAYRDKEIDEGHALTSMRLTLKKQGIEVPEIALGDLDALSTRRLVADTFPGSEPAELDALSQLLFDKTLGNPFFLSQLLIKLHKSRLIRIDRRARRWTWDKAEIQKAPLSDNVVDLLIERLRAFPPATQRLLSLAACVGQFFDLAALSRIAEKSRSRTAASLWPALREGLVVPLDAGAGLTLAEDDERAPPVFSTAATTVAYRFLHDRVKHAAYSLISVEERRSAHLSIGRDLSRTLSEGARAEELFEAASQMNAGQSLLRDRAELTALARLDLRAGRAAKAAAAFEQAHGFFAAGARALAAAGETEQPELAFSLGRELAECAELKGDHEEADARITQLLSGPLEPWQRLDLYALRVRLHGARSRFADAVEAGREALSLVGIELPRERERAEALFAEASARIDRELAERSAASLLEHKELTNPETQATLRLLIELIVPSFCNQIHEWKLVCARQVQISLAHGHFRRSALCYVTYGYFLMAAEEKYAEAMRFGKLATALVERFDAMELSARVNQTFGMYASFGMPLREAIKYFEKARDLSTEYGDLLYGIYASRSLVLTRLHMGEALEEVEEEIRRGLVFVKGRNNPLIEAQLALLGQLVACLQGRTHHATTFDSDDFDEQTLLSLFDASGFPIGRNLYFTYKLFALFLHGDLTGARALLQGAEETYAAAVGQSWTADLPLYGGLLVAELADVASAEERPSLFLSLERYRDTLSRLSSACPENARHKERLLEAELARLRGQSALAIDLYEQAIVLAHEHGYLQNEAIAAERAALFFLARGNARIARAYMSDARYGYRRWGARMKVRLLEESYPHLLEASPREEPSSASRATTSSTSAWLFDVNTAFRAMQIISSEIVLDRVIAKTMRVVLANAGAQRGFLALDDEGELKLESHFELSPDRVEVGLRCPLSERSDLCHAAVHFVARTHEPLVIADASREPQFASDAYVLKHKPKSLLAIALMLKGFFRGVLYLENNVAPNVFDTGRVEMLQMICTQTAIAVDNAKMYTRLQDLSAELSRSNEQLEQEVSRQTEDLRLSARRLEEELMQREETERARAALQEEVIAMQRARLEELSTPLIPITSDLMVLPLIGTVDAERAERVLETALFGVQRRRARVVIIDITGVNQIDAQVADSLIRTAGAVRLLGARVVLTGIRPHVARVLVELGVSLKGLVTRGTLQDGIAHAMNAKGP